MLQIPFDKKTRDISGMFFKKLVSKIPDLLFQLSLSPEGELSSPFLNKAVIQYFELSKFELRNFDLSQRIIENDYNILLKSIHSITCNTALWTHEFRAILPTKGLRWFKAVASVEVDDYNYISLFGRLTDITIEKEEEKKLVKSLQLIGEQNGRLQNFAHIVSHNLNSHTGNFKMLLDLIENEKDISVVNDIFGHLRTSSNALNQTIEHLKELVDINTNMIHKKENLNLNDNLIKVFDVLKNDINKNNVKIFNKISHECYIDFNPSYLESILLNFTTNAIKYSHPDRIPEINYFQYNENGKIVLVIQDNGLGIDLARHGDKIFGMYKTFHNNENARGIGLFITKNQIEAMGGNVTVESEMNVGTTFKIFFNNEI